MAAGRPDLGAVWHWDAVWPGRQRARGRCACRASGGNSGPPPSNAHVARLRGQREGGAGFPQGFPRFPGTCTGRAETRVSRQVFRKVPRQVSRLAACQVACHGPAFEFLSARSFGAASSLHRYHTKPSASVPLSRCPKVTPPPCVMCSKRPKVA